MDKIWRIVEKMVDMWMATVRKAGDDEMNFVYSKEVICRTCKEGMTKEAVWNFT